MKKIDITEINLEETSLADVLNTLAIPFLTIELKANPIGFGVSYGANKIGADYLEEKYNISKEKLKELTEKYLVPATDKFIDEIKELEKSK